MKAKRERRRGRFHRCARIGKCGFTLVELVLVILVASVALLPLLSLFAQATADSVQPFLVTQAVFLAQEKIEEVLADAHAPSRGFDYITGANYPPVVDPPGFPGYSVYVSISADSLYDGVTFREVEVKVANSAIGDVVLKTWVAEY